VFSVCTGALVCGAAGLTAGIDGALRAAAPLRGEAAARAIQLDIQYAPEPPFDCGHPDKAPADIVARQRAAFRPLTDRRLATARRVATRLGVRVAE